MHKYLPLLGYLALSVSTHSQAALISADLTSGNANLTQVANAFTNGLGNTWTLTVGGVTITMTSLNIGANGGSTFATAELTPFSSGLGSCNSGEQSNCSSDPQHRVDNNSNGKDFVLFQFSTPVDVTSVTVTASYNSYSNSYRDTDASYWLKNVPGGPIGLVGLTTANMGLGSEFTSLSNTSVSSRTFGVADNWSETFLLAARISDSDDYFKIKTLVFDTVNPGIPGQETGVPEPATFAGVGCAAIALAVWARRMRKA